MTSPTPDIFTFDLPLDGEPEISHIVRVGTLDLHVLAEPNLWLVLKSQNDALSIIRQYLPDEDYAALDDLLSKRKRLGDTLLTELVTKIVNKPTGRPTNSSDEN